MGKASKRKLERRKLAPSKSLTAPSRTKKREGEMISRWLLPVILLTTFLAFIPVLKANFVNLDDNEYVTENPLVKRASNLGSLLVTPVQGNYHPLTMLTLSINHMISGNDAWSYHLLNLLLHLINCFLVFQLAMLLSKRNTVMAFTVAILFSIHPMHVESVAWVTERKDVLYGLFFLAGLISYTKFIDTGLRNQYALTILLMVLSLLSKPAAVVFPLALLCIDLLRKRKFGSSLLVEKIPFFALALIGGVVALVGQRIAGASGRETFPLVSKILFGFYGIMMYCVKAIAPFNLSAFYSFPPVNESLPIEYYLAPLFFVALAALLFYSWKMNNRVVVFGILFFLVNLLPVLQLVPVGSAVIADRYTYIPYIGLDYAFGWLIYRYTKRPAQAYAIIFPIALLLSVLTWMQAAVWHNSATLWDHAISTQPSNKAYANRADLFSQEKNYDRAIEYYNKAIALNTIDYESYNNRGNAYLHLKKFDLAQNDYRKAISLKPDYYPAMDGMAAALAIQGQYLSALNYSNQALAIDPNYKPAYSNRALTYMKLNRYEDAIRDWQKFLQYEPNAADVYDTIGSCYQAMGKYQESLAPISKAIELSRDPTFYLNRSYSFNALKDLEAAQRDALAAKQGGAQIPDEYAARMGIRK